MSNVDDRRERSLASAFKPQIVNLITDNRRHLINALSRGDAPRCSLCDLPRLDGYSLTWETSIEMFELTCGCGRPSWVVRPHIEIGSSAGQTTSVWSLHWMGCHAFDCEHIPDRPIRKTAPDSSYPTQKLPVPKTLNVKIHNHHTSYERDETIVVCASCHAEIHNSDAHEHLQPDISRKEWEE